VEEFTANPVECAICKFIVSYVDTVIANNKSEAAVEAALDKVCTILPHTLNGSCYTFIKNNEHVLIEYILKHGTPELVCDALKACSNRTQEPTSRKHV
jgi:saposin